ncbi:MAG: hypothetical protein JNK82_39925 [Myxococcaceae bacterium]|nr:hypothetical protein [Myxococcaceae bacterium]
MGLVAVVLGVGAVATTRVNVVWYRNRPWVLKFGPAVPHGHCRVSETADPTSDVLSNLIDVDSDGTPEYRSAAFIDASPARCERRAFLGFWRSEPVSACFAAAASCERDE